MSDAVQMLREQHAEVAALFMKLERLTEPRVCAEIFRTIDSRLRDHTVIEETVFYPAFRDRARDRGRSEIAHALHEHDEVKTLLDRIEQSSHTEYSFKEKISELRQAVEKHVREEESTILPQALRLFSEAELDEMALRMMKLASIHSPAYQLAGHKTATVLRDTLRHIGEFVSKVTS
jgi:hemerythrin superfamily protein